MGLLKEDKLTADYVLRKVDEAEIFSAYFGPFKMRQTYSSVFRKDKNPSCGFYLNKSGKIIFNDLTTGEKLDCFAFVAKLHGITYGGAIHKVACDFRIIDCAGSVPFDRTKIKKAEIVSEEVKKETVIEIIPDTWSPEFLSFWDELFINREELVREDVYPVKRLFINGKLIPNYSKDVRYAYIIEANNKSYKKIYTPHAKEGRFKWISNIPLHIPFGINKLPQASNHLIITKSAKDRILFKKYFPDVIGTQNESPSALNENTRKWIAKRYDQITINQDLDEAGINSCEYFSQFGYHPLFVPEIVKERHGIKDFADMVKRYGLNKFEDYLKHIHLL